MIVIVLILCHLQGGALMLREVPWLVVSDSNFTSNGRLPKAAAADDEEEEEEDEGPATATFGGALGVGWRGGDSPDRNVTLLNCRCALASGSKYSVGCWLKLSTALLVYAILGAKAGGTYLGHVPHLPRLAMQLKLAGGGVTALTGT
jgi:hypothetical protein